MGDEKHKIGPMTSFLGKNRRQKIKTFFQKLKTGRN